MRNVTRRTRWALTSRTVLFNLAVLLVGINELIPVVTQYQEVVPIPDAWIKRALFAVAVGNVLLRRVSKDPVTFRRRRVQRIGRVQGAHGAPGAGWDGDPEWPGAEDDTDDSEGER